MASVISGLGEPEGEAVASWRVGVFRTTRQSYSTLEGIAQAARDLRTRILPINLYHFLVRAKRKRRWEFGSCLRTVYRGSRLCLPLPKSARSL